MRILITGNLGYVGQPLSRALRDAGHQVQGLDVDLYQRCQVPGVDPGPPISTLYKDIRDVQLGDLAGFEAVTHLAGLSNDPLGELDPTLTMAINATAGIRLAQLAKRAGVRRFIALSSCSIYGAAGDRWIDEASPPAPLTAYAKSKLALESGLSEVNGDGFEVVIARPGTVFGVSPRLRFDLVLNNLVAWALATGIVRYLSDGSAWRPLLHVRDLAAALAALAILPSAEVAGRAFNIGFDALNLRVGDLGQQIVDQLPGAKLHFDPQANSDPRSYRVCCQRLAELWAPTLRPRDIRDGIAELRQLLRDQPVSEADFDGPRYQRVAHLRWLQQSGLLDQQLRWRSPSA